MGASRCRWAAQLTNPVGRRRPGLARAAIRLESALRPQAHPPVSPDPAISMPSSPIGTPWVVLKFGGTSVSQRHRWDTIGRLAGKRAEEIGGRVLVVVSALSGWTNDLTAGADGSADSAARVWGRAARPRGIGEALGLDPSGAL